MKKLLLLATLSLLLLNCSSKKSTAEKASEPVVQYRDDFKSVSEKSKMTFLKGLKATGENHSVILLTKGFIGEHVTVFNGDKALYQGNPISHLETGIAGYFRINNTLTTKITDKRSKKEAVIDSENAKKHKFIYIMKDNALENPYKITYSNTLRPLN